MSDTSSTLVSKRPKVVEDRQTSASDSATGNSGLVLEQLYGAEAEIRAEGVKRGTGGRPRVELPIPRECIREGAASTARLLLSPLGRVAARYHRRLADEQRLAHGLVVLLPGIDGCTTISDNIARGLDFSERPMAIEVHDWRSFPGWNPLHLATYRRNRRRAGQIARRILDYRAEFKGRPVHIVGHSAGAGMALFVVKALRRRAKVNTVTLLAAAISRRFDVRTLSREAENGIWNFWSRGDLPAAGVGTMIFGTVDRVCRPSAGALGFRRHGPAENRDDGIGVAAERFFDVGFQWEMLKYWNWGGHFGCTNTAFIKRYVAPIINEQVTSVSQLFHG